MFDPGWKYFRYHVLVYTQSKAYNYFIHLPTVVLQYILYIQ